MNKLFIGAFAVVCAATLPVDPAGAADFNRSILPVPDQPFKGKIGLRASDSIKDFPNEVQAPEGAPNVLLILTDDVGFGASSTFGGPVPTPTMERIANQGLRFNQFHTTALCSPTRAALLTGRNHHSVSTGGIMEIGVGYPGYNTLIPQSKRGMGDILKLNGYNTAWFGKNHNVPDWHSSQAGPFDLWPVGLGFEYFYGFIGGDTSQWAPAIVENTRPIEPPHDDPDYNVAEDFSQSNNLAESNPEKLRELQRLFYIEAVKYNVLPLDNTKVERLDVNNRPSNIRGLSEFTYYDGMVRIPEGSAPDLKNKSFGISAVVEIPRAGPRAC